VIAAKNAENSRLLSEPFAVSSALSLPNTKLLLRLRDEKNEVIDEVDDGIGVPFAGLNPSGTGAKASMERIDASVAGNLRENWRTSTLSSGFDPGLAIFGTPGFSTDVDIAPDPPVPDVSPSPPDTPLSNTPFTDPLEIAIAVQSGPLVAVGKATVNFQAVATAGSLSGVSCAWSYGDGFSSTSCNPPVHSFTTPGTYSVRLEAKNQCGTTLIQEQIVEVLPDPATATSSSVTSTYYDGSRVILTGALPNPAGTDTGKEWVEIKNMEQKAVDLRGWKLAVGESSVQSYQLKDSIGPGQTLKIYDSEMKFKLPNTSSKLQLIAPNGAAQSTIVWKSADDDRTYFTDDIRSHTVRGRVLSVMSPTSFLLDLDAEIAAILGAETVTVIVPDVMANPQAIDDTYEFIGALLEREYIELKIDTDGWDEFGSLRADAVLSDSTLLSSRLIMSKKYVRKSALNKKENEEQNNNTIKSKLAVARLRITEVYASPFPHAKGSDSDDWKSQEWLEIENIDQKSVDLSEWKLKTSTSEKTLPLGLKVISGSSVVVYLSSMRIGLRNSGDVVRLVSPDGDIVSSVEYPALKNGMSYAADGESFCQTIAPTPGQGNVCRAPITRAAKAKATASKKATAKVRSYATAYKAQLPMNPEDDAEVIELEDPRGEGVSVFGIFLLGILTPIAILFLILQIPAARRRFLGLTATSMKSL
jgi:PKD repeat protein